MRGGHTVIQQIQQSHRMNEWHARPGSVAAERVTLEVCNAPGHLQDEGGVDFREFGTTSPKLEDEFAPSLLDREKSLTQHSVLALGHYPGVEVYLEWNLPCLALCSWRIRVFSIFTGLGMKPISQPSFTRRPIHQSLLNFYTEQWGAVMSLIHLLLNISMLWWTCRQLTSGIFAFFGQT